MAHYISAKEIAELWHRPIGTVHRLASEHGWKRTADERRPVLYLVEDVEKTMDRLDARRAGNRAT